MKRIYHRWEHWECYPAGFFEEHPPQGLTGDQCQKMYAEFLADKRTFEIACYRVIDEWVNSCEHNLTNETMNRIAWMDQAAMCIHTGISSKFRGGYHLLTEQQQQEADLIALKVINYWMFLHGYGEYTLKTIKSRTEANLY